MLVQTVLALMARHGYSFDTLAILQPMVVAFYALGPPAQGHGDTSVVGSIQKDDRRFWMILVVCFLAKPLGPNDPNEQYRGCSTVEKFPEDADGYVLQAPAGWHRNDRSYSFCVAHILLPTRGYGILVHTHPPGHPNLPQDKPVVP